MASSIKDLVSRFLRIFVGDVEREKEMAAESSNRIAADAMNVSSSTSEAAAIATRSNFYASPSSSTILPAANSTMTSPPSLIQAPSTSSACLLPDSIQARQSTERVTQSRQQECYVYRPSSTSRPPSTSPSLSSPPSSPRPSVSKPTRPVSKPSTSSSSPLVPPPSVPKPKTHLIKPSTPSPKPSPSPLLKTPSSPNNSLTFKVTLSPAPSKSSDKDDITKYVLQSKDPLPTYVIPDDIKGLIEKDVVPGVLYKPLHPSTYKDYFAALLYAEDHYVEVH